MNSVIVPILDCDGDSIVEARLHVDLPADELDTVERSWRRYRHRSQQHKHWNWSKKAKYYLRYIAYRCLGIEYNGQMQGVMLIAMAGHRAMLPPEEGHPLVYVNFLETAPWNLPTATRKPRYKGIGTRLVEAAIRTSQIEGFHGRIGLHSLPQSAAFYESACNMQCVFEADPDMENLPYYEMTTQIAENFLRKG